MYIKIVRVVVILISIFLYLKIDEKYKVANKIKSKLNINKEWKAYILAFIILIIGLIISAEIRSNHIPYILTSIVSGIICGIALGLSHEIVV